MGQGFRSHLELFVRLGLSLETKRKMKLGDKQEPNWKGARECEVKHRLYLASQPVPMKVSQQSSGRMVFGHQQNLAWSSAHLVFFVLLSRTHFYY